MKEAANVLEANKENILQTWIENIRKVVPAADSNIDLVLRDHIPLLMEDIISIMRRYENFDVLLEEEVYDEIFESSKEHGRHRAATRGYTVDQILREYISFHRIVTNVLMKEQVFTTEVGIIIKYSIENAMLYSAAAFSNSIQEMRQKLIGILAHDMRNPIAAAYLAVDMMNYEHGQERFDKVKQMARSSIKRALGLVEGLLDSILIEAGEGITLNFSKSNLMEVIKSVHTEASDIYTSDIILECEEKEIIGVFDSTMVRRVLENFLSNAIKYGDREKPVTIRVAATKEIVELQVHNFGTPIPEEDQEAIFTFLNTSDTESGFGNAKSWGMGLTLVKAVAEGHGGELCLESAENKGTTFSIRLNKNQNTPGKMKSPLNYEPSKPDYNI